MSCPLQPQALTRLHGVRSFTRCNLQSTKSRRFKVVIVGAGAAGLGAARQLLDSGGLQPSELLVLEGSSERIGGRIHTKLFEAKGSLPPVRVDLGASYLHGYEFEPDDDKNSYDAMMLDGYGEVQPARSRFDRPPLIRCAVAGD